MEEYTPWFCLLFAVAVIVAGFNHCNSQDNEAVVRCMELGKQDCGSIKRFKN